jgi:predicted ATPase/DNA-binding CsgD family transcriptional regulator/DNA-binding XRE family transcriptional regulator
MGASFGMWLRQRRRGLGLSQQELAGQVGCSAALIRKIEVDERRPSRQIAELLIQRVRMAGDDTEALLRAARARRKQAADQNATSDVLFPGGTASALQPLSALTEREQDILKLLLSDLPDSVIAERLSLKISTVRWYVKQIYSKLGVHSREEAMLYAEPAPAAETVEPLPKNGIRHNLPASTTSLVGRQQEIQQISTLLRRPLVRLVTLVGTAGVGKTRLSLETATDLRSEFPDGVYFVALAALSDASLLANMIAQVVGVTEVGGPDVLHTLRNFLQAKHLLLVLDNFEHLLAGAPLVTQLLYAAGGLKILVTSREPLHIYGEHEYPVHPLRLPGQNAADSMDVYDANEAVALFVQRAAAVQPDFQLTSDNVIAVADICTQLDGLPLAIELAAARVKRYAPAELQKRLHRKLALLTGGARDLPERHQTLRAALAWSYDLLDGNEQKLFARLGIFIGGWATEAMEAICGEGLTIDLNDGLESLLNKSLIQPMRADSPRFTMLETMREYALEKLAESGEAERVRQRHAAYYRALVEQAEPLLRTAERRFWIVQLTAEDGNIRSILHQLSSDPSEAETAIRIAANLWHFWATTERYREGIAWLEALNPYFTNVSPALQVKALHALAILRTYVLDWSEAVEGHQAAVELARRTGDQWVCAHSLAWLASRYLVTTPLREQWLEESLSLARALGDPWLLATVLGCAGQYYRHYERFELSQMLLEEALAIAQGLGEVQEIGLFMVDLGETLASQGKLVEAKEMMERGLVYQRQTCNKEIIAGGLGDLGDVERLLGNYELARMDYEEALAMRIELGNQYGESRMMSKLGFVAVHQKRLDDADVCFRRSLEIMQERTFFEDQVRIAPITLIGLATIAAEKSDFLRAVVLLGAVYAQYQSIQRTFSQLTPADRAEVSTLIARLHENPGRSTFADGWDKGASMTWEQAVQYALSEAT